ncbi:MAG: transcription antitermination factor NusB [Roseovarius sp.]|uniref:RsmB/NOP family class I SAM-dependent RNA methyltransferase n=1 Tax=Roseovarius sp. TaxID=1486281 RepID=UPI0032EB1869
MSPKPSSPRAAAVSLLDEITGEGQLMSDLTERKGFQRLAVQDRAAAQRLATQTLRGLERADRILDRHLRKRLPLGIKNILRLGTVELCLGGDAHGVVNELVALAPPPKGRSNYRGLINAVLRKVAEEDVRRWNDLRIPRLPGWLRDPLVQAWGKGAVNAMEKAHFAGAPLDLTVKGNAAEVAEKLGGTVLPTGSVRIENAGQVSRLEGYEQGDWWVQDAAAALPAKLLAAQPGERVLDLCAAPGGKTLQLAATGAEVTALDISERRMARVQENLDRTDLTASLITGDALEHQAEPYYAILLDAPCSATGTIRRHPDLPFAKDGSEFGELIGLQAQMIDHAMTLLKPGGRLLFCTCSLLPDEGECQVEEALQRHDGLTVDRAALDHPGIDPKWITEEGGLRLRPDYWPELGGMDGFYIAVLRKP